MGGEKMQKKKGEKTKPRHNTSYSCYVKNEKNGREHHHSTVITLRALDDAGWEKIVEVLTHPEQVRERVTQLREQTLSSEERNSIEKTVSQISRRLINLYTLAER